MTEEEWLSEHKFANLYGFVSNSSRCSQRVKFLLAAAACRRLDPFYPDLLCREAIDLVERAADGKESLDKLAEIQKSLSARLTDIPTLIPTEGEWAGMECVEIIPAETIAVVGLLTTKNTENVFGRPEQVYGYITAIQAGAMPTHAPFHVVDSYEDSEEVAAAREAEAAVTCMFLREVFGNPFRPIAIAHRTATVSALARAAYEERIMPSGELDVERLAVMADALEESGAAPEAVDHLRGPGPHIRGCHVVDLCLGLS
jgi:hypothetical protein